VSWLIENAIEIDLALRTILTSAEDDNSIEIGLVTTQAYAFIDGVIEFHSFE
jgi:hypothetical protein